LAEWLLIIGFGLLSLGGWQRLAVSLSSWYWLTSAGVTPGPAYLAVSGGLWGLIGLLGLVWFLLRARAYRWVILAAALVYAATYWLDRLLISRADGLGANLVFASVATLVGLLYTALVLRPWRKG
jgi:hypothetical protein